MRRTQYDRLSHQQLSFCSISSAINGGSRIASAVMNVCYNVHQVCIESVGWYAWVGPLLRSWFTQHDAAGYVTPTFVSFR